MNANRVLAASAAGAFLLGLGVLEVMSLRVRVDQPPAVVSDLGEAPTNSWPEPELDFAVEPTERPETDVMPLFEAECRFER